MHARHYRSSLARSIVERFPATVWLTGSEPVANAALAFVADHPPTGPCIAEYGWLFPEYLAAQPHAGHLPYLKQFATIDWHLGRLAVALDDPPVVVDIDWSLGDLFQFYLTNRTPDRYELRAEPVRLELQGRRGELWIRRI